METQTSDVGFTIMLMKKVTTAESTFAWVKLVKVNDVLTLPDI